MLHSPRPVPLMSAAPTGHRLLWNSARGSTALRCAVLPLALAAVSLPAFASHRALPVPARHPVPQRPVTPHAAAAHAAAAKPVHAASSRGAAPLRATAHAIAPPPRAGTHIAAGSAKAGRSFHGKTGSAAYQAHAAAPSRLQAALPAESIATARHSGHRGTAPDTVPELPPEPTADRRTQDRVHAWYRTHPASTQLSSTQPGSTAAQQTARVVPQEKPVAPSPDLATSARKATTDDFYRAAAAQRDTIQSAAEQSRRQTTAADDDAAETSRIPSTAPTEREPAPFVHGGSHTVPRTPAGPGTRPLPDDDRDTPAGADATAQDTPGQSRRSPAPIVRRPPAGVPVASRSQYAAPAAAGLNTGADAGPDIAMQPPVAARTAVPAIAVAPPARVDWKHRGDGLNAALASDARTPRPATIPVLAAADSSPRAVEAVAAETAASPTPRLKLPAPPGGALRHDAPAVAAVQKNARKPELDPSVAGAITEESFADSGTSTPATARAAVTLASAAPASGRGADATDSVAAQAAIPVNLFDGQGKLILLPPMKGSHEILVHQNQMAVSDGLERIQDDAQLAGMRRSKLLVALPDDDSVYPDDRLPDNRRYARPWVVRFIRDIAKAHYARFGTPLVVTSAVRTVEFQRRLVRINGNAAPPTGDIASPHLYGQAIDFAKGGMSVTEIAWMRAYLTPVEAEGKIDVEEEFQQACFHMSVYRRYLGAPPTPRKPETAAPPALLNAKAAPSDADTAKAKKRKLPTALLATGLR